MQVFEEDLKNPDFDGLDFEQHLVQMEQIKISDVPELDALIAQAKDFTDSFPDDKPKLLGK